MFICMYVYEGSFQKFMKTVYYEKPTQRFQTISQQNKLPLSFVFYTLHLEPPHTYTRTYPRYIYIHIYLYIIKQSHAAYVVRKTPLGDFVFLEHHITCLCKLRWLQCILTGSQFYVWSPLN